MLANQPHHFFSHRILGHRMPLTALEAFENGLAFGHVLVMRCEHHGASLVAFAIELHQHLVGQCARLAALFQIGQLPDGGELGVLLQALEIDVDGCPVIFIELGPFGQGIWRAPQGRGQQGDAEGRGETLHDKSNGMTGQMVGDGTVGRLRHRVVHGIACMAV